MRERACRAIAFTTTWFLTSGAAWAQPSVRPDSLRGLVHAFASRVNTASGFPSNTGSDQLSSVLFELMALEVSTAPYGTSTGGFTFAFDSQLGTFTRLAPTFGPAFAERSLTTGRHKLSVGFNVLHAAYNSLAGQDLTNLIVGRNGINPFGPVTGASLELTLSSATTVAFANYGVTNDFDLGVAVPWVRISFGAAESLLSSTGVDLTAIQPIGLPQTAASGFGDVAIIGKYRLRHDAQGGVSAAVEVHLPTGDTNDARGTGVTRTLVSAIWSRGGKVAPHANLGYEFWSAVAPISPQNNVGAKNALKYAGGVEIDAHPRLTVVIDAIGRRQLRGGRLGYQKVVFPTPIPASAELLLALPKGLNVVSLAPGIKWNAGGNVLITGNVLVAVANDGLRANATPVLGLDWTF